MIKIRLDNYKIGDVLKSFIIYIICLSWCTSSLATVLTELNLKSNQIGDGGAVAFSRSINPNSSLKTLTLDNNGISSAGGMGIASLAGMGLNLPNPNMANNMVEQAVGMAGNLSNISISGNMVGPAVGMAMAHALMSNPSLHNLSLSHSGQDLSTVNAFAQVTAAPPHVSNFSSLGVPLNPNSLTFILGALQNAAHLTNLDLASSNLGDAGASAVASALSANFSITSVNLSSNGIGNAGASALAAMLQKNTTLQNLNLSTNKITDMGASALASAATQTRTLKTLDLTGNTFGQIGIMALMQAQRMNPDITIIFDGAPTVPDLSFPELNHRLPQAPPIQIPPNLPTMKTWPLKNLKAGPILGALLIKQLQQINVLQNLQTGGNMLGDAAATDLVSILSQQASVDTLDLSDNNLTGLSAGAISAYISRNPNLQSLDLSDNQLGDMGISMLARAIAQHPALTTLTLNNTNCGDMGASALGNALKFNTTLKTLSLENNKIGNIGAAALAAGIAPNMTLTSLNLASNQIGTMGASALAAVFTQASLNISQPSLTSLKPNIATLSAASQGIFTNRDEPIPFITNNAPNVLRFGPTDLPTARFTSNVVSTGSFMSADTTAEKFIAAPGSSTLPNISLTHSTQRLKNTFAAPQQTFIPNKFSLPSKTNTNINSFIPTASTTLSNAGTTAVQSRLDQSTQTFTSSARTIASKATPSPNLVYDIDEDFGNASEGLTDAGKAHGFW